MLITVTVALVFIGLISYNLYRDKKKAKARQQKIDSCDHDIEYDYVGRGYDDDYKYEVCHKCGYRKFLA